jgi:hypothetical protein
MTYDSCEQTALQFAIEHFVDWELKATLGEKGVDKEHQPRVDEFRASSFGKANRPHYGQRCSSSALRISQVTPWVRS